VAGGELALATMAEGRTRVILNTYRQITGAFARDADLEFPAAELDERIEAAAGKGQVERVDASRLATALLGDSIASNLFMLGYAYQLGLVPVSAPAIEQAIILNGVAVEMNSQAFLWGRRAAHDGEAVRKLAEPEGPGSGAPATLDEIVEKRAAELTAYQDATYAGRYRALVDAAREAEAARAPGLEGLAETVARQGFRLMAYKDEYEVARLYSDGRFRRALESAFEGDYRLAVHLAPPLLVRADPVTGDKRKLTFGPWMLKAMAPLAKLKGLRGTALDIFGYTEERRAERQLIADYEAQIAELGATLDHDNHALAMRIAALPERIRGYGHVKERAIAETKAETAELLTLWRNGAAKAAAE
jgi:indolepyruvate ferredoxin oxidoreductase